MADNKALADRQFRKKPVVIEAVQYPCEHPALKRYLYGAEGIEPWTQAMADAWGGLATEFHGIETLEGVMRVTPGDWIITGVQGEHYPCKPDIFAATYEPAALTATPSAQAGEVVAWKPIETAPKSAADGSRVDGIYLLGFAPEEELSPEACIDVVWWEPLLPNKAGGRGKWVRNGMGDDKDECAPTHWMPLPPAPDTTRQPAGITEERARVSGGGDDHVSVLRHLRGDCGPDDWAGPALDAAIAALSTPRTDEPAPTVDEVPTIPANVLVSVDVSTCDDDAEHRIFARTTGEVIRYAVDGPLTDPAILCIEESRNYTPTVDGGRKCPPDCTWLEHSKDCPVRYPPAPTVDGVALPNALEGDFDCPKAMASRECPCGFCVALRKDPAPAPDVARLVEAAKAFPEEPNPYTYRIARAKLHEALAPFTTAQKEGES